MPATNSIAPLRVFPTDDATMLSHQINRQFDLIAQYLSDRFGFSGPVRFYNGVDLGQNGIVNVGTSTTPSNAATVEQLALLKAQVEALGLTVAGIILRPPPSTSFVLLSDSPPGGYPGQAGKGVAVNSVESALEFVSFALLADLVTTHLGLTDTDDSYVGHAGHVVTVRTDETGLTFAAISGGAPLDATLQAIADLVTSANTMPYFTGIDTAALATLTPFIRTLLDDPDLATAQATLGITGGGTVAGPQRRARHFMHMGS